MKMNILTIITLSIVVFLSACSGESQDSQANKIEREDLHELIDHYNGNRETDESASITATELIITDGEENESVYNIAEEEFFVSIAPFINETHPCTNHSLTGCQGEMADKDFDLYIEDTDGNVIIDETMNSGSNGFIDLWLPREQTYNVKITFNGKHVESEISTFENDGTCITTMQL